MVTDYYSILRKAIGNADDKPAREHIYDRARSAVARLRSDENLTPEQISVEALALEAAIQRIEDEFDALAIERVSTVLSAPRPWRRVIVAASVFFIVAGLAASALWYFAGRSPPLGATATRPNQIVPDLDPGVDGGSSGADLPFPLQRQVVYYRTMVVPGSIVVDREKRFLYLIQSDTAARRYGIGVSSECLKPASLFRIANKVEWPEWKPSPATQAKVSTPMPGGPGNPLGARALLLDQPERFIHGTNSPKTIGHLVALGCIRLVNDDVEDLYRRVPVESKVIMRN
jgi:lipoprotein-anchoring transpeptidase ErfK/SrfK